MDSIYIDKVLKGDTELFAYFVNTYKDFAVSLSFSITKNRYLAEDIAQESFIKAFENLKSFRYDSSFKTWFARIVINESLRVTKNSHKTTEDFEELSITEIQEINDGLNELSNIQRREIIEIIFQRISSNEALVMELFYLNEFSVSEIRELTSWSPSKIKMTLSRGRKNFYCKLSRMLKSELKEIL